MKDEATIDEKLKKLVELGWPIEYIEEMGFKFIRNMYARGVANGEDYIRYTPQQNTIPDEWLSGGESGTIEEFEAYKLPPDEKRYQIVVKSDGSFEVIDI